MDMTHPLAVQERDDDSAYADLFRREQYIGREAADLAMRLTDGRAYTTLVDACDGYAPRGHRITLADEFVAWCRQRDDGDGVELVAGVLFRRQGAFDGVVRDFTTDYAAWQADKRDWSEE